MFLAKDHNHPNHLLMHFHQKIRLPGEKYFSESLIPREEYYFLLSSGLQKQDISVGVMELCSCKMVFRLQNILVYDKPHHNLLSKQGRLLIYLLSTYHQNLKNTAIRLLQVSQLYSWAFQENRNSVFVNI